jgi:hypothetical protein
MQGMFYDAEKFNKNISRWEIHKNCDIAEMFQGAINFKFSKPSVKLQSKYLFKRA